MPARRIVRGHADHELADRPCRGRPSGPPAVRVIPLAGDQAPMPGQQRRGGHREHLAPPVPGDQPRQCGEPQPVARLVADPADLAAEDRVLVPEHQEFGIPGQLTPGQHHQAAEQAAREEVAHRDDHPAMMPAGRAPRSRRSAQHNRVIEPHTVKLTGIAGSHCCLTYSLSATACASCSARRWPTPACGRMNMRSTARYSRSGR